MMARNNQKIDSGMPPVFCIYENPADYPGKFVVRRWVGMDPDREPVTVAETLDAAREALKELNPYLVRLDRCPDDDPVILETWI